MFCLKNPLFVYDKVVGICENIRPQLFLHGCYFLSLAPPHLFQASARSLKVSSDFAVYSAINERKVSRGADSSIKRLFSIEKLIVVLLWLLGFLFRVFLLLFWRCSAQLQSIPIKYVSLLLRGLEGIFSFLSFNLEFFIATNDE